MPDSGLNGESMQKMKALQNIAKVFFVVFSTIIFALPKSGASWKESKGFFTLKSVNGRGAFIDPDGKPFYSLAMVYAYGPESPTYKKDLASADVISELKKMKEYGFNTLNLYGDQYLDDVLNWCEQNNMAFYPRTSCSSEEFPDFMDPAFRDSAKHSYDKYLGKIKNYRCVLAVDMDLRWMYRDVDWSGKKHPSLPALGKSTVAYFPKWLKLKYGRVMALNRAWGKTYAEFEDVLADSRIIEKGAFVKLERSAWRDDVAEYVHWAINDFLKDLTFYMKGVDPNHMITYTTELPEIFSFPVSNKQNSGIDFASPVHYNADTDFGRDWISLAKIIAQCKFHSDLTGEPAYISESGWRTKPLEQKPPLLTYAMARPGDEKHKAELYIRQAASVAALPFLTGWSYFMWYDKWLEGDFGFINDDGSPKPIAVAGKAANAAIKVNWEAEKEPAVYLYYPQYAFGSPLGGFVQYKGFIATYEYDFLSEYDSASRKAAAGDYAALSGLPAAFNRAWAPFKYVQALPKDQKPVLLCGDALEQLSLADRGKLDKKNTISFCRAGIMDEKLRDIEPWYLKSAGIEPSAYEPEKTVIDISRLVGDGKAQTVKCYGGDAEFKVYYADNGDLKYASASGQSIMLGNDSFSDLQVLAGSKGENVAAPLRIKYTDGTSEEVFLGPTVPPLSEKPAFGHVGMLSTVDGDQAYVTHVADLPLNPVKKIASITLPSEKDICVFAVSATRYGTARSKYVTVDFNGVKIAGRTAWATFIRPPGPKTEYKVLASFENGCPAVVQSRNGKHIVFLYDALSWNGEPDDISAQAFQQSAMLKQLLGMVGREVK